MFPLPPNEAVIVSEFFRIFDAVERPLDYLDGDGRLYVPAAAAAFDEHRNTSRVFPVAPGALEEAQAATAQLPAYEPVNEQLFPTNRRDAA